MQTLVRRLDKLAEPEIIIADEAHHCRSASYMKILNHWPNAKAGMRHSNRFRWEGP